METDLLWWGYRHIDGSIHVKRYFNDPGDLAEASDSPFVDTLVSPFEASSREEAMNVLKEIFK